MNTNEIEGNWKLEKGKLKQKFALLTDNDQLLAESHREEILGRQQINLAQTKKELKKRLTNL